MLETRSVRVGERVERQRDLGAMVSMNTRSLQQVNEKADKNYGELKSEIEILKVKNKELEAKLKSN